MSHERSRNLHRDRTSRPYNTIFTPTSAPECGNTITATRRPDCLRVGDFGLRLMTHITMMEFQQCGVLRRIQNSLQEQNRFQISPKGLLDILLRVGDACVPEYERIVQQIREAQWRHTDETRALVQGKNHWLWIFRTDHDEVLVMIRPSRGKKVLEENLSADFHGAMVNDGFSSYRSLVRSVAMLDAPPSRSLLLD